MQARDLIDCDGDSEAGEVFCVVSNVIYGPNVSWVVSGSSDGEVVMKITGCPLLKEAMEIGADYGGLAGTCQEYVRSAVENLNPRCTSRYTKCMCSGDDCCENVIGARP